MSRLEKKCFVTSAGVHVLLVLVLLVGPAFISSRNPVDSLPVLDVIPTKLIDDALSGGGSPTAKPPPPSPIMPREAVAPTPVTPVVVKPRPEPQPAPEPPKPEPRAKPKRPTREMADLEKELVPSPTGTQPLPKPTRKKTRRAPEVSLTPVERKGSSDSSAREQARQEERRRQAIAAAEAIRRAEIANAVQGIRQNLTPGIEVSVPGPGGEAYANYGQIVRSIYDRAWILPDEVTDDSLTVQVIVTIARDGTVVADRTRIKRRSGNTVVDRSVERTLERVRTVAPFPEGAKESEREFIIYFNVKAKRSLG